MEFKFSLAHHGDVILEYNNKGYNFGYNYNSTLPIMLFLNHKQNGFGNLFKIVRTPDFSALDYYEMDFEELLGTSKEISSKLPLPLKDFNDESYIKGISHFNDGYFRDSYRFTLNENKILVLTREENEAGSLENVLRLTKKGSESLADSYLKFVSEEHRLVKFQGEIQRVVSELS